MNTSSPTAPQSITDSPWYWVYLFSTAGAIALLLAGPKFAVRQAQIERKYEARQYAAQHVAEPSRQLDGQEAEPPDETRITLWPLYAVLGGVLSLAWFNLWRNHQRRRRELQSMSPQGQANP